MNPSFRFSLLSVLLVLCACCTAPSANSATAPDFNSPKYEFRGAWMHIIGQGQYARMNPEQTRAYLIEQLDLLQRAGCNAIIWQIRPQADAAYPSELEPWTRWLTGTAGKAPNPVWDPVLARKRLTPIKHMSVFVDS